MAVYWFFGKSNVHHSDLNLIFCNQVNATDRFIKNLFSPMESIFAENKIVKMMNAKK